MEIRTLKAAQLRAAPYNPRRDLQPEDAEYQKLRRSIETFGMEEDFSGYSDGKERDTFTMTFSLPAGARETVEQYIQQTENAKTELATAIINRVKGVI